MSNYRYSIEATWRIEPTSPAGLGEKFLGTLDAISEAVPKVGEWQLSSPPYRDKYISIDEAHAKLADWVEKNAATEDGAPDPDSGYSLIATAMNEISPKVVALSARIGGRDGGSISFRVGSVGVPSDLDTVTYPLFRAAMLGIVTELPPVWANAKLYAPDYTDISLVPGVPPHPATGYQRPWLSYLCAPLAKNLVPPVGVPCERTPDGGLLMIAAEERLDPTNADHMRRSRAMAEVMIACAGNPSRRGFWPIDEEWPPTPEARSRRGPPSL